MSEARENWAQSRFGIDYCASWREYFKDKETQTDQVQARRLHAGEDIDVAALLVTE